MANWSIFLITTLLTISIPTSRQQENNPLFDIASSLLQNLGDGTNAGNTNGLAAIGNLVGTLMQGDNAKNLGALFGQQDNGNNNVGDILNGLGSLMGNQNGQIDPNMIGSMVTMFAQQMANNQNSNNENANQKREKRNVEPKKDGIDSIMNMASSFLESKNAASMLPLIMNTINAFSGNEAEKRAHQHEDHASFLPPFLEKAHLYWDIFINSELGKTIWEKYGLQKVTKAFTGADGKISFETMFKSFENHSFRRHWIKAVAKYLTETVVHMSKPEVNQRYLATFEYLANSFLDAQGLPKTTHFNSQRPEKSLTALINYTMKKYLDIDTDVYEYVKQAITYLKQTVKMAQQAGQSLTSRADYNALADRITDTLNLEVIEPVLRVYRAYRHSVNNPQCQEHLMCLVNRHLDGEKGGLPGFKRSLTKISSIVASAALSFQNGKGFWDLYNAIQNDVNCKAKYPADCASFHEHEEKVTTEIYHSEL